MNTATETITITKELLNSSDFQRWVITQPAIKAKNQQIKKKTAQQENNPVPKE